MRNEDLPPSGHLANPGYLAAGLGRLLDTAESHGDAATRERAVQKAGKWLHALQGMLSGQLRPGTRRPDASTPVWATPEVITGGFVTGDYVAAGPLQPHEQALAQRVGGPTTGEDRQLLNRHFLTEPGFAELLELLGSGCYEVNVPEEGALPVVAWLLAHGHAEQAHALVETLAPFFSRLRFYPAPARQPASFGARVFVESVQSVLERVDRIVPNPRIEAQREAIEVWAPLYAQMIGLFLETVAGETPTIQPDAEGRWTSAATRQFNIVGGWPCRDYADDWSTRARQVLTAVQKARSSQRSSAESKRLKDSFVTLQESLERCLEDPTQLTGREVGMIRLIIARHVAKHGAPDSEERRDLQARQRAQTAQPTHHDIAKVVLERLAPYEGNKGGLEEVESFIKPVTEAESVKSGVPAGAMVPPTLCQKLRRCLCETADTLVSLGVIRSGETLAQVIPQFTATLRAQSFQDPQLRTLYASVYQAFRRRRSLLLFNLEKQIRMEELPWVAAMERHREQDATAAEPAQRALKELALLDLRAFPQAILPNKLLQEFRALAKNGGLEIPFVEELAADIFMGDFSPKFTQAAKMAALATEGSLYARYYDVDFTTVQALPDNTRGVFAALCSARVPASGSKYLDVAYNGMVLEQSQIITTHNLALLLSVPAFREELLASLPEMARQCFRWICRRQQAQSHRPHARLIMLKQTAYAWRQMIFYLSLLPPGGAGDVLAWATAHLEKQPEAFRARFAPALNGLVMIHQGGSWREGTNGRRFLGWTKEKHWLLGD